MKKNMMKKFVATGIVCTMVLGGASAAFAKGNDKNDDHGRNNGNSYNQKYQPVPTIQGNNNNVNIIQINFNDMKNAQWAMRYIASLASKRVFEGYEDGSFKPSQSVSRIEAITAAVRLMGLRDQAESAEEMATKLNFKDADKIPAWAVGYVAVALENDLFSENEDSVQPNQEANRLWATTLLVKALKLEGEAKAKMNSTLPFKDAKQIPAGSVGYIQEALDKKLVDGFEDNTFRPNQNVTRAELAALLDRTSNQLPDQDVNTGTVGAAVYNNVLILTQNGSSVSYNLHPDAFILRNGVKVAASELLVGDTVKFRMYNNTVVYVEVTGLGSATQQPLDVTGILNSTTLDSAGKITSVTITNTTTGQVVTYNVASTLALTGNLGSFTQGHVVQLKGTGQIVSAIDVK
ncbi:S-layer homology domain-containing protein [Paenibacillus oryzisoli]|uniref:S-layer homology domain-containing protein n=1 Tax=Paenibacillus oryzisoli TaxID=1850517 RepID=UPI003D287AE5